ncbi:hypothetical protein [Vibrio nigripulchritudo]|uniref:hypothetical protein n=1 Tax=Vibrio nigripulchritudo TaxID=28173 RepID=UPI00249342D8|nr:hypothetical protein [Vibrio nigripulchritudo]BDU42873.1 hypothetical protein TUMSATVNIG3_16710 [Vibrio nigripulchritudo]BDU42878.1 hypothetical protein TUMSATVNIG3_16760 [Vibrio nigripulchritudo]
MQENDSRKYNGSSKKGSAKRKNELTLKDELAQNGLAIGHLVDLLLYNFDSLAEASEYFGCTEPTLKRWIDTKRWYGTRGSFITYQAQRIFTANS